MKTPDIDLWQASMLAHIHLHARADQQNRFFNFIFKNFMYGYFICMYILAWRPEVGIRSPGTKVTDGCKLQCGKLNLGPLWDQPLLLTSEPSLQSPD